MAKKQSVHYVDNKEFLRAMVEYKSKCSDSESSEEEPPPIPEYIGECLYKIATHLSFRPNFVNYSYKDEMISDALENCINYLGNFNPEKSSNPFAYFTQIIYYAFIRRIEKEKKQTYIKHKALENTIVLDDHSDQVNNDERQFFESIYGNKVARQNRTEFIENFEQKKREKKEKAAEASKSTKNDSD